MFTIYNGSQSRSFRSWRDRAKYLKDLKHEVDSNAGIMTQYERMLAGELLNNEIAANKQVVVSGALAEWNQALNTYQEAVKEVDKAKTNEINRWKAEQLRDEIQLSKMLVEGALTELEPEKALQALYQEAKQSGDIYKQRAIAEGLRGLASKQEAPIEAKMVINSIAKQAERDLEQLRTTPELEAAHNKARAAVQGINQAEGALYEAGEALDRTPQNRSWIDNGPLDKARSRVVTDGRGNILEVLPAE